MQVALLELHTLRDPGKLVHRIRKLCRDGVVGETLKQAQLQVLHEGLPLAAGVNEAFAVELLALVPDTLTNGTAEATGPQDLPRKKGELLERAFFLASHFNRVDFIKTLINLFTTLVLSTSGGERFRLINRVARPCMRSMKKHGLNNEVEQLLTKLHNAVNGGTSNADLRKKHAAMPEVWASVLQTQLNLAAGWMYLGFQDRALPIMQEARNELLNAGALPLQSKDYTELARAYVSALGQNSEWESGMVGMIELFRKMDPRRINNTWTTAQYYSRFHFNLIEETVLAVCRMASNAD